MIARQLRNWWQRIRTATTETPPDSELQDEIQQHLTLLADKYVRQGMTPDAALLAARRQFGNTTLLREDRRTMQTMPAIDTLRSDLHYAVRTLWKNKGFAAGAIATLALGIGANTAIFSICNAVLLKPLPYAEPDRLVMLWERMGNGKAITVSPANFVDWRSASRSFSELAALDPNPSFILNSQTESARLTGAAVSWNFFSLLGVKFALGRNFVPEEDQPGENRVAILSYRAWQDRFGADKDIAGKQVTFNDIGYTIAGVLPQNFEFASKAADFAARSQFDIWVPIALDLQKLNRGTHPLRVIARLKNGVNLKQAQSEMDVLGSNLARLYQEDNKDKGIVAVPLDKQVTADVKTALQMLVGAVALVLLIACTNVANLLLSRAAARQREIAVRVALGAGRWRLAQQLLTESLLLASIGGIAGVFLAWAAIISLSPHLPAGLSRAAGIVIDGRILGFTAVVSLLTGIVFGLGPVFGAQQVNAAESLKQNNRVTGGRLSGLRSGLAIVQIAIAIVLLIGAGLMVKSFWTLMNVAPGFRSESILTARLSLPSSRYPDNRRVAAFERELKEHLAARPSIESVGFATYLPLSGSDNGWAFFIEGASPLPKGVFNFARYRPISPGYFETIGIPVLRGRAFTPADTQSSAWTVVINASMARQYWGTNDPIGRRIRFNGPELRTIIGVVGDVLHESLDGKSSPEMYVPVEQAPNKETGPTIVLRTALDAGSAARELRQAVATLDRSVPIDRIETMEQMRSGSVAQPRFRTVILAAFSLLALIMASIGIYGVINYLVIQRTREFGIRLSVGATRSDVLCLVLHRAAVMIGTGTCIGLAGSILLVRLIRTLLFGTAPVDPLTFAAVPVILAAVALAASYIPARRATRVDPVVALRYE